jgi:hypothetical protein
MHALLLRKQKSKIDEEKQDYSGSQIVLSFFLSFFLSVLKERTDIIQNSKLTCTSLFCKYVKKSIQM